MSDAQKLAFRLRRRVGAMELQVALETSGTLVITGPNGAGKSSLLSMLLGTLQPEEGWIRLGDATLLDTAKRQEVPLEQRRWGYVPQRYALFPHLDVRGNVAFGVSRGASRSERRSLTDAALGNLGLAELAMRRVQSLSGGERQRVALARALASAPNGLLLDEPLAALDVHARQEVRTFLGRLLSQLGLPTIIVTHDIEDARTLGMHIAVMEEGRVAQYGSWDALTSEPETAFVRALVQTQR